MTDSCFSLLGCHVCSCVMWCWSVPLNCCVCMLQQHLLSHFHFFLSVVFMNITMGGSSFEIQWIPLINEVICFIPVATLGLNSVEFFRSETPNPRDPLSFPYSVSKAVLSFCQFISLSVCVPVSMSLCVSVWPSRLPVRVSGRLPCLCFPLSVAWASVALHEMNALFPPRF